MLDLVEKTNLAQHGCLDNGGIGAKEAFASMTTLNGLAVTIRSVLDLVPFLFKHGYKYVLTGKLNQDAIEARLNDTSLENKF